MTRTTLPRTRSPRHLTPRRVRTAALLTLVAFCAPLAPAAAAQPVIHNLGIFSGAGASYANGISADGSVVVGSAAGGSSNRAFRWTAQTGLVDLLPGVPGASNAFAVSADGSVILGFGSTGRLLWTPEGAVPVPPIWGGHFSFPALSGDGSTVVGQTGDIAARWSAAEGITVLGTLGGHTQSWATGANADGSVVVGWSGNLLPHVNYRGSGFRWSNGILAPLNPLPSNFHAEASAVTPDGVYATGFSGSRHGSVLTGVAVRWVGSTPQSIQTSPGFGWSYGLAINADGSMIVGEAGGPAANAFLWTTTLGMVNLNAYLPTLGVDLTGWHLSAATAISADGSAIAGFGFYNGQTRAWLVTNIPAPNTAAPAILLAPALAARRRRR